MNITVDRAVLKQALEALEEIIKWYGARDKAEVLMAPHNQNPEIKQAMELVPALRTALEQLEPEPVWWMLKTGHGTQFKEQLTDELKALTWNGKPMWVPLYTAPPQRKPLSDDEIQAIWKKTFESGSSPNTFARAIEAKLKEKNT